MEVTTVSEKVKDEEEKSGENTGKNNVPEPYIQRVVWPIVNSHDL
jgi:hypothetical protein